MCNVSTISLNTIKYDFRVWHPRLFNRCHRRVTEIPVYHNGEVICVTSMNPLGHFFLCIPSDLARKVITEEIYIQPDWTEPDVVAYDEENNDPVQIISLTLVEVPDED